MSRKKNRPSIATFVGDAAHIEGTIRFTDTIRLDGRVTGLVKGESGTLIIGKTADVDAEIHVDTAIIMGRVRGRIRAEQRIELYAPADVTGDLFAPVISMEKGVRFNGNCDIAVRVPANGNRPENGPDPTENAAALTGEKGGQK